jgi:hypothetical protein
VLQVKNLITIDAFKLAYKAQYESQTLKNPLSKMHTTLDSMEGIDDVINYADEHPTSRTAKVLLTLADELFEQETSLKIKLQDLLS